MITGTFKYWFKYFHGSYPYPVTFQEPVTVIAYNLFSVHHDVFFFIIIILSLVYWSLYKIIKDFNWHISTKQDGIIQTILTTEQYIELEIWIHQKWYIVFKKTLKIYCYFLIALEEILISLELTEKYEEDNKNIKAIKKLIIWFIIGGIPKGFTYPKWYLNYFSESNEIYEELLLDKYSSYLIYNYTSNSRLYHDIKDDFLITQRLNTVQN